MKKVLSLMMAGLMTMAFLAGCSGSNTAEEKPAAETEQTTTEEAPAEEAAEAPAEEAGEAAAETATNDGPLTIGVSMNSADEFRASWLEAFKTQAEAKGHKVISTNADNKADKQISDIESMLQQDIDIIVIHAFSSDGILPAVDALNAANIPIVLYDFPIDSENYTTWISDEQYLNGVIQGEYVNDWLAADESRVANVGYYYGSYSMEAAAPRMDGFFETCTKANKLVEAEGGWTADGAMSLTEDWLQAYPDMNVFVAMNDEMALGCIQALKAAGKNMDDVVILGIDGSQEGITAVKSGELDCTVFRDVQKETSVTLDTCEKIMKGESVDKRIEPKAAIALTSENVDQYAK